MKSKKEAWKCKKIPSAFAILKTEKGCIEKSRRKFIGFVIIILLIFALSLWMHSQGSDETFIQKVKNNEIPPALFIAGYIAISFVPIPFSPTPLLGGFIFKFGYAFIYTLIATAIFSCIIFIISRYLGRDYIRYLIRKNTQLKKIDKSTRNHGFIEFFYLRLFYLIPVEFVSVLGAFSEIKFKDFFFSTILGSAPVLFFSIMLVRARINNNFTFVMLAIIGLILLLVIPLVRMPYLRKYFQKE